MDRAYLDARQDGISRSPIVEMVIQSTLDDTLAPRGAHVASLFCQHFAPRSTDLRKQEAGRAHLRRDRVARAGFRASLIAYSALSPADLERDFGLVGGDIFTARSRWISSGRRGRCSATPITGSLDGLYLCGSGAHPAAA